MRALVLSGGGAKGSYQLGVYKALKKLGIKIDIITGTSIGSINGALLVAGDYKKAKKMWLSIKTTEVLNYDLEKPSDYTKAAKEIFENKGLKFDKAEGFITRDARKKERKKPGLKKARRAPQFSKR